MTEITPIPLTRQLRADIKFILSAVPNDHIRLNLTGFWRDGDVIYASDGLIGKVMKSDLADYMENLTLYQVDVGKRYAYLEKVFTDDSIRPTGSMVKTVQSTIENLEKGYRSITLSANLIRQCLAGVADGTPVHIMIGEPTRPVGFLIIDSGNGEILRSCIAMPMTPPSDSATSRTPAKLSLDANNVQP